MRILLFSIIVISFIGCTSNSPRLDRVTASERERILDSSNLFPGKDLIAELPTEDIFQLTDDMKDFVEQKVSGLSGDDRRVRAILRSLLSKDSLNLKYDERASFTAEETFREGRANCLSFTTLIVPMLRYLGIKVEFNEVDVPPIWDLQNNNMVVLYEHVNAVVTKSSGKQEVLDINMDEYELHYPQHVISDKVVEAHFYNNRGMEFMLKEDYYQSFRYLRKAIELAPQLPFVWTNLGIVYRELDRFDDAEIAFRIALEYEPDNLVAISNAARNYRNLNNLQLAEIFSQRADYYRNKNPYYRYYVAVESVLAGDYETALKNINTAISRYKNEHRFYFLQGVIYKALQENKKAESSFSKALEMAEDDKDEKRYRGKMEKLML